MVEVFKTNVTEKFHAEKIISEIHAHFQSCRANFDLQDCDRILRVKSMAEPVQANLLIYLVNRLGFKAEVLPDLVPQLYNLT